MKYHLIAIGGSAMHNLALALHENNQIVSGSDDEIYNPSKERLLSKGLLPDKIGWDPKRITKDLDAVILGMHARIDNPELLRAQELNIPVYSYPEFIYQHARHKKRVVIAGSHGKTSTTSMIMFVLNKLKMDFDYLVGAQIEGFETMVRLSNAPVMVIEGDEYLSSPIDRRPKMLLYAADIAVITGISWDHMNVFPSFENYKLQFDLFLKTIRPGGTLIGYAGDNTIQLLMQKRSDISNVQYEAFERKGDSILFDNELFPVNIFGNHNLENLKAASLVCKELGIDTKTFLHAVSDFSGAAKRLQKIYDSDNFIVYKDFAHAPSKVMATVEAIRQEYPKKKLISFLELHTYSSLNKAFIPQYKGSLDAADEAYVYFDDHTLEMKKLPPLSEDFVKDSFANDKIHITKESAELREKINNIQKDNCCLLFMSSGNFGGIDLETIFE